MCALDVGEIFVEDSSAAFLFRNFVIAMFPCGILSTFKVTQSSSKD